LLNALDNDIVSGCTFSRASAPSGTVRFPACFPYSEAFA